MKTIYLTGFMAAGKTSVGKEMGKVMNLPVVDTDQYIEEKLALDIPVIFDQKGEIFFRDEEQAALLELPRDNVIVTTGGGIILRKQNRRFMKENGIVIALESSIDTIIERLRNEDKRPLAVGKSRNELLQLFEERQAYYHDADLVVSTDDKSIPRIASEIIGWIKTSDVVNNEY